MAYASPHAQRDADGGNDGFEREPSEWRRVLCWRWEHFRSIGYSQETAYTLACDLACDWHQVENTVAKLIQRGCPPALAREIAR